MILHDTFNFQEMEGRIWQCRAGHLLCEPCKERPEVYNFFISQCMNILAFIFCFPEIIFKGFHFLLLVY